VRDATTNVKPRRFFFCHLQKTAGSSLLPRLEYHFGETRLYPSIRDGSFFHRYTSVHHLLTAWDRRADQIEMVCGHFPLCTHELLSRGFTAFTVLREPVERTLSFLRSQSRFSRRNRPLVEMYQDPFLFSGLIHNYMVKMLSLSVSEMTDGQLTSVSFTRDRLELAKERLAAVEVFGIQERFDEFCEELTSRFGFSLGEKLWKNRTEAVEIEQSLRDRIAEDNAMDMELYEFALKLYRERRANVEGRLAR
jgi:Sulfotransferase family